MFKQFAAAVVLSSVILGASGCSSGPEVKKQAYAELKSERTFEYEFPVVWKGIEEATRKYKVINRDPKDVDANEMRRLRQRAMETDWIFTRSNDKYVEYKANGLPRKIYLQTRIKYRIDAQSVIGGTQVKIDPTEEIEKLNDDGSPAGWEKTDQPDTSRAADLLDRIQMAILSQVP